MVEKRLIEKDKNKKQETKTKRDNLLFLYIGIFIILILGLVLVGWYQVKMIRQDYDYQITNLQKGLDEKQNQIDNLSSKLEQTNQNVVRANEQYDLQLSQLNQKLGDLSVESESFSNVIQEVIDATVSVVTDVGQGSGAIITKDGLVVTNYHVIQGAKRASIYTYDGEAHGVKLVGYDINEDIAVLDIITNQTFDYFNFGDSDSLIAGQKVVALGNPAGLSFTATEGIISSPKREIYGDTYIQTDVTINPGNSGGPLINSLGEIVGIVNFKISDYDELGFAIPSNRVENVVDDILG